MAFIDPALEARIQRLSGHATNTVPSKPVPFGSFTDPALEARIKNLPKPNYPSFFQQPTPTPQPQPTTSQPSQQSKLKSVFDTSLNFLKASGTQFTSSIASSLDFATDLFGRNIAGVAKLDTGAVGTVAKIAPVVAPAKYKELTDKWIAFFDANQDKLPSEKAKKITADLADKHAIQPSQRWQQSDLTSKFTDPDLLGETILMIGPGLVSSIGTYALNPLLGFGVTVGSTANDVKDDAVAYGVNTEKAELLGLGTGLVVGMLEKVVPDKIFAGNLGIKNEFVGGLVRRMTNSVLLEAGTEVTQEGVQLAAEKTFREDLGWDEAMTRVALSAFGGALGGGVMQTLASFFNDSVRRDILADDKNPIDYIKEKGGQARMTPDEALGAVVGTQYENTEEGRVVVKAAIQAQEAGQDIVISQENGKVKAEPIETTIEEEVDETRQIFEEEFAKREQEKAALEAEPEEEIPPGYAAIVSRDNKLEVIRPKDIRPEELPAFEQLENNPEKMINDYIEKHGNKVGSDEAKTMFNGYNETNSMDYDRVSGALAQAVLNKLITDNSGKEGIDLIMSGGGTGSGKSTTINKYLEINNDSSNDIFYDSTFSNLSGAIRNTENALKNGLNVDIYFVYRNPVDAFKNGVMQRYRDGEARTVPVDRHLSSHKNAIETILTYGERYRDNQKISVKVFENITNKEPTTISLDKLQDLRYNAKEYSSELNKYVKQEYRDGNITKEQAEALIQGKIGDESKENARSTQQRTQRTKQDQVTPQQQLVQAYKDNQQAVEEALSQIWAELDVAQAGKRVVIENPNSSTPDVVGIKSTFPKWVPEELRSRKLFDQVLTQLVTVLDNPQYPPTSKPKLRDLYATILDDIDYRANIDTQSIRNQLLEESSNEKSKAKTKRQTSQSAKAKTAQKEVHSSDKRAEASQSKEQSEVSKAEAPKQREEKTSVKLSPLAGLETDISRSLANESHRGTSHTPEKRGESEINSYVDTLTQDYNRLKRLAKTPEKQALLDDLFLKYREGYKSKIQASLRAHSQLLSPMITGAANFPTRRNSKRFEAHRNRIEDEIEYRRKMLAKIKNALNPRIVASDDPEVLKKLKEKLHNLETNHKKMLDINKIIRSKKDVSKKLTEYGLTKEQAEKIQKPDFAGRVGFPGYALTSSKSKMKATKQRIEKLQKVKSASNTETAFDGGKVVLNPEIYRLQIMFDSTPDIDTRSQLRSKGFKWSPKQKAWQRALTPNAIYTTERVFGIKINRLKPAVVSETQDGFTDMGGYADVGGYADTQSAKEFFKGMKPVEMPELVAMTKSMLGSAPTLKRFKAALGKFYLSGNIKLSPDIFNNPTLATKVMAHEMGHMVDWFDQKSLSKRGSNILGRIASLNKYMKHMLKEHPGAKADILTPKDRQRLMKEAKKLSKTTEVEITTQEIVGTTPIKPEEVIAIWNSTESMFEKDPALFKYIAQLSAYQKKSIVVQAMKGTIPKWVKFERNVTKSVTRKMLKNAPADIRNLYRKLIKQEVIKRRLFERETVMRELRQLSMKWKPFNPAENPSFTKYRFSSPELYADAISVLFNDPSLLRSQAPTFWKAFFNYLDSKPQAKKVLFETWDLLNQGQEAVINKRISDIGEMFSKGEEGWARKNEENKRVKTSLLYKLQILFDNKNTPVNRKVDQKIKEGVVIPDELNPTFALQGLNYGDGKLKNYIAKHFNPIYQLAGEIDQTIPTKSGREMDGWEMLGTALLLERSANERGELANPGGHNPKTANETLAGLYSKLNPVNKARLQKALKMFRESVQHSIKMAEDNRFYNPEMLEVMKANKTYATFQVLDYIDTYISAHVYHQVGTLKDVANPATSTVMKLISLHQNIERNNAKKINLNFLSEHFSNETETAKTRWNGRSMAPLPPKDHKKGLVTYVLDGKVQGMYVEEDVANVLNYTSNKSLQMLAQVSRAFSRSGVYRPLFTAFNLGFQSFNFVRDFKRFWKNMPDMPLVKAIYRYIEALPASVRRGFDIPDATIAEMENKKILGLNFNSTFQDDIDPGQKQIERVLVKTGILKPKHPNRRKALLPVIKTLELIEALGNTIETIPKVAGYNDLKGKLPDNEMAQFIRTSIGSPDFRTGGTITPISNSIFLFSNAIKEGIKSDMKIAFTPNKSRSSFWIKTFMSEVIPKLVMFGILAGKFGDEAKEILEKQSEYDKTNYTLIPLGLDENGKGIVLRIPSDETGRLFGSIFWKLINTKQSADDVVETVSQIFSFGANQFPNLSPAFTGIGALIQYLSGNNPYDSFRNRNIIPDAEFEAGHKESWPIFLDWLIKNQGGNIVLPSKHYGDLPPTNLEKLIEAPILSNALGRWIKVSDYGETESLREITKQEEKARAQKSLNKRRSVEQAIDGFYDGDRSEQSRGEIEKQLVEQVVGKVKNSDDKRARTNLIKEFRLGIVKGTADPLTTSLIYAQTNSDKVLLLQQAEKKMNEDEFGEYLKQMMRDKVISKNVYKEVRRQR